MTTQITIPALLFRSKTSAPPANIFTEVVVPLQMIRATMNPIKMDKIFQPRELLPRLDVIGVQKC